MLSTMNVESVNVGSVNVESVNVESVNVVSVNVNVESVNVESVNVEYYVGTLQVQIAWYFAWLKTVWYSVDAGFQLNLPLRNSPRDGTLHHHCR